MSEKLVGRAKKVSYLVSLCETSMPWHESHSCKARNGIEFLAESDQKTKKTPMYGCKSACGACGNSASWKVSEKLVGRAKKVSYLVSQSETSMPWLESHSCKARNGIEFLAESNQKTKRHPRLGAKAPAGIRHQGKK